MAKFRVNLLVPYLEDLSAEDLTVQYYRDCITNFESNNNLYNYTFDEQITINKNAQEDFSFKMLRNIRENDMMVINPFFTKIKNGTLIEVVDKYNFLHWFVVNKIDYAIKTHNIEISYSATDYFNNCLTKRETAYEINNDPSTDNFIGAKNLQYWINKICDECKIAYSYIPLQYEIYATYDGEYIAKLGENYYNLNNLETPINIAPATLRQLIRKNLTDVDKLITYSLSGSSAANAIINLGEQYGLIVEVDYRTKTFWYKEAKNSTYTGLRYSPNVDLQSLSIGQQTNNLTTIFNIQGPEIAGEKISLLSPPTPFFMKYFTSQQWLDTQYYPGMYTIYLEQHPDDPGYTPTAEDEHFAAQADTIPFLESKIFKSSYIQKVYKPYLYQQIENILFNDLRINNGKLLAYRQSYYSALKNKVSIISETSVFNDKNGSLMLYASINNPDGDTSSTLSAFYNSCKSTEAAENYVKNIFTVPTLVFVLDKDETITYYGNSYRSALQRFLKNIYNFTTYYNAINDKTNLSNEQKYQLSIYWEAAYNASLYCDFVIPKDWQRTDCWRAIKDNYDINNDIVPQVSVTIKQPSKQYIYKSQLSGQNIESWMTSFCSTAGYSNDSWETVQINGQYQDIYSYTSGGLTWLYLIEQCCNLTSGKIYLKQGWYQNFIKQYLLSIDLSNNSILSEYNNLVANNKAIWKNLFKEYGMLLLETSFTSETATSTEELYNEAMTYYAEYEKPEKTYSLTITDISVVKNYISSIISVGDQIALDYNEFYQEEDDLKDLLQQHLFINSIKYNLRKDSDIQYDVTTTSFYDKLLSKLANLIK